MWIAPLIGGALIGIAATLMMAFNGRVMGVSGILGGLFHSQKFDRFWRWAFLLGMLGAAIVFKILTPEVFGESPASQPALIVAGLLVGVGTQMSGGCTSGHGVCGMSRLSLRSIVATLTFMGAGFITVWLVQI